MISLTFSSGPWGPKCLKYQNVPNLGSFRAIGKPWERFQSWDIRIYFIPVPKDHTVDNVVMYQNRSISGMVLVLLICCLQEKVSFDTNTYMLPFNIHSKSKPHSKCDRGQHSQFCRRKGNTSLCVTVCKMVHSAWQIAFNSWTDNSSWLRLRRSTSDLKGTLLSSNFQESPVRLNILGWTICLTKTCSWLDCLSSTSSIQRQSLWPICPWNQFFATVWFLEVNCEGK